MEWGGSGRGGAGCRVVACGVLDLVVVIDVLLGGRVAFLIEVLELHERLPLRDQAVERRRVLPGAVPRAGGVAEPVCGISYPQL